MRADGLGNMWTEGGRRRCVCGKIVMMLFADVIIHDESIAALRDLIDALSQRHHRMR